MSAPPWPSTRTHGRRRSPICGSGESWDDYGSTVIVDSDGNLAKK
ncbi:hypothetical protein [Streptomyces avermitilis]